MLFFLPSKYHSIHIFYVDVGTCTVWRNWDNISTPCSAMWKTTNIFLSNSNFDIQFTERISDANIEINICNTWQRLRSCLYMVSVSCDFHVMFHRELAEVDIAGPNSSASVYACTFITSASATGWFRTKYFSAYFCNLLDYHH